MVGSSRTVVAREAVQFYTRKMSSSNGANPDQMELIAIDCESLWHSVLFTVTLLVALFSALFLLSYESATFTTAHHIRCIILCMDVQSFTIKFDYWS